MRWHLATLFAIGIGIAGLRHAYAELPPALTRVPAASEAWQSQTVAATALANAEAAYQLARANHERDQALVDDAKRGARNDEQLRRRMTQALASAKQLAEADTVRRVQRDRLALAEHRVLTQTRDDLLATLRRSADPSVRATTQAQLTLVDVALAQRGASDQRIPLPNAEVDPLADPEDLEAQSAALRETETALAAQAQRLQRDEANALRASKLRRQHDRALALANRDLDLPGRTSNATRTRAAADASDAPESAPIDNAPATGPVGPTGGPVVVGPGTRTNPTTTTETPPISGGDTSNYSIVLGEVVAPETVRALRQQPADPGARAKLLGDTKLQVLRRLATVRQQRLAVEARAKALRQ